MLPFHGCGGHSLHPARRRSGAYRAKSCSNPAMTRSDVGAPSTSTPSNRCPSPCWLRGSARSADRACERFAAPSRSPRTVADNAWMPGSIRGRRLKLTIGASGNHWGDHRGCGADPRTRSGPLRSTAASHRVNPPRECQSASWAGPVLFSCQVSVVAVRIGQCAWSGRLGVRVPPGVRCCL